MRDTAWCSICGQDGATKRHEPIVRDGQRHWWVCRTCAGELLPLGYFEQYGGSGHYRIPCLIKGCGNRLIAMIVLPTESKPYYEINRHWSSCHHLDTADGAIDTLRRETIAYVQAEVDRMEVRYPIRAQPDLMPGAGPEHEIGEAVADETGPVCEVCGADLENEDCWHCHGEGSFDLYEDNPNEYAPGDVEPCCECGGTGQLWCCPDAKSHPEPEPEPAAAGSEG